MSLPAGVTRIPRRAVTYTTLDSFPLAGRFNNQAAGDIANQGNPWQASNSIAKRYAYLMENVMDSGDLMAQVLGMDCRAWVQLTATLAGGVDRTSPYPNSIYFGAPSAPMVWTPATPGLFQPGDRLTIINVGSSTLEMVGSSLGGFVYNGAKTSLKLKVLGAAVVLEYTYIDATTLGWMLIAVNGTVGTYGDGSAIGLT